jgi:hypothetical protein
MKVKSIVILSIVAILLMAFSGPVSTVPLSTFTAPVAPAPAAPYRTYIGLVVDDTSTSASPPSTSLTLPSAASSTATLLTISTGTTSTGYSPQPGDAKLTRDKVFLDLAKSRLIVSSGSPVKVSAVLTGNLPDACHLLRIVVGTAASSGNINIQVYSLFNPGVACITVLKPFSVTVPLGSFTSGQYTVMVNGILLGRFTASPATITLGTN